MTRWEQCYADFALLRTLYAIDSCNHGRINSRKHRFERALIQRRPFFSQASSPQPAKRLAAFATCVGEKETVQILKVLPLLRPPSSINQKAKAQGVRR